jgi:hypothetical protein
LEVDFAKGINMKRKGNGNFHEGSRGLLYIMTCDPDEET